MPKPGFKSIIVSENIYKKFFSVYEKRKNDLELKWIKSFSGYLTSMMEEMMLNHEAFAKQAPFMEKISIDSDRVLIKDNKRKRIAEVILRNGELRCFTRWKNRLRSHRICLFSSKGLHCIKQ